MFPSRAFAVAGLSLLALTVSGTNTPPSTTSTSTEGAHVSQPPSIAVQGSLTVSDFLCIAWYSVSAAASIVAATTSKYGSAPTLTVPWIEYTLACVTPTPAEASDMCSSASLYTFTEDYGGATLKYQVPVPWYANPKDRANPHVSASLTAVWSGLCTYDPVLISRKCHAAWTSFTFPVPQDALSTFETFETFMTPTAFPVTAGWEKMATLGNKFVYIAEYT